MLAQCCATKNRCAHGASGRILGDMDVPLNQILMQVVAVLLLLLMAGIAAGRVK